MRDFAYRLVKDGGVHIAWRHRHVVTLAGDRAMAFRRQLEGADPDEQQLLMARVTGNFKRGNERRASERARRS